ncbi:MAG: hypothetical protein RR588_02030 [Solibacillus sp.]
MGINLVARFSLVDQFTRPMRNMSQQMTQFNRIASTATNGASSVTSALGRQASQTQSLTSSIANMTGAQSASTMAMGRQSSSIGGLIGTVGGLATAYVTARGAVSLFNSTVGAAIKHEQSTVAVQAIFNDKGASDSYLKMVENMALTSPVLSSGEMLKSSKGLVAMTRNVKDLGGAWSVVERLQVLDPTQGTEGAAFALKELWQGDAVSMVDRFGLNRSQLNDIKKLSIPKQIAALSKMLDGMGITQKTIEAMGGTTAGVWQQISERAESAMRKIGEAPNGELNKFLTDVLNKFEKFDVTSLANSVGSTLSNAFKKAANAVNMASTAIKYVKDNKNSLISSAKMALSVIAGVTAAVVTFRTVMGTMAVIGTVTTLLNAYRAGTLLATAATLGFNTTLLANPIGLVVAGIAALIGIGVALALNWDAVTAKTKEFWSAIGKGEGLIALVLGPLGLLINAATDLAKNWDSTKGVWENVWGAIQRSAATSINAVIGAINTMINTINAIPGVNIPIVPKVDWGSINSGPYGTQSIAVNSTGGAAIGHYNGLDNVKYDGYTARLHKGEKVLTRREADAYRSGQGGGGGITIAKLADQIIVREEADIGRIADQLVSGILAKRGSFG